MNLVQYEKAKRDKIKKRAMTCFNEKILFEERQYLIDDNRHYRSLIDTLKGQLKELMEIPEGYREARKEGAYLALSDIVCKHLAEEIYNKIPEKDKTALKTETIHNFFAVAGEKPMMLPSSVVNILYEASAQLVDELEVKENIDPTKPVSLIMTTKLIKSFEYHYNYQPT